MPKGRKTRAALQARRDEFDKIKDNGTFKRQHGLYQHRPGSQNYKKGYGAGGRRR